MGSPVGHHANRQRTRIHAVVPLKPKNEGRGRISSEPNPCRIEGCNCLVRIERQ
jgi:hypothetical protein